MQYRPFGKTGVLVSALGFGAMRLPMTADGQHVDEERAIPVIHRAFELGVNLVDTAPYYCKRESEIIVGKALRDWPHPVYLSTKNPIEDGSGANWRTRLEQSLRKLDRDYVDFYHMWGISWKTYEERVSVPDGPLEAAQRAKAEGLIKHMSFSFHDTPDALVRIIDSGNFETMLVQYNLLDRKNEAAIHHAHANGLGVAIMGPVGGGRLGVASPEFELLLPGRVSTPALALRFVLAHPGVSMALSGMSTMAMVEENVAVASQAGSLSADDLIRVKTAMEENQRLAELYCTGCEYCMPCPNDVNIPKNFEYMNYFRAYGLEQAARDLYGQLGKEGTWVKGLPASACVECGECEPKCPQNIPIIKQLRATAEALA